MKSAAAVLILTIAATPACALRQRGGEALSSAHRVDVIRRAAVWRPTDIRQMNIRTGPATVGGFQPDAVVDCVYVKREMNGRTPKFTCALANGDEVKVKYGLTNGEVYAEVAATRLLWALGFGADAMFPVRVRCHRCPASLRDVPGAQPDQGRQTRRTVELASAAIERKMPGVELGDERGGGWAWPELRYLPDRGREEALAHRDALTLLAALLQHTDSKREQQRLVCLDDTSGGRRGGRPRGAGCERPFMLISDLGKTFGRANVFNRDAPGSVNLEAWRRVDVWLGDRGCRANLARSATGTLDNPVISEPGRRHLARLLQQLSEQQLVDLFTIARFTTRADARGDIGSGEVRDWVEAFRGKVRQIAERSCEDVRGAE